MHQVRKWVRVIEWPRSCYKLVLSQWLLHCCGEKRFTSIKLCVCQIVEVYKFCINRSARNDNKSQEFGNGETLYTNLFWDFWKRQLNFTKKRVYSYNPPKASLMVLQTKYRNRAVACWELGGCCPPPLPEISNLLMKVGLLGKQTLG